MLNPKENNNGSNYVVHHGGLKQISEKVVWHARFEERRKQHVIMNPII